MALMSTRGWDDWISEYAKSHTHPANRLCHTIGIPMIALSILVLVAALVVPSLWKVAAGLFVVGWIFQFAGHYVYEKRSPAFYRNLAHLLVGPLWILAKALRRA